MGYSYDAISDITSDNVVAIVKAEATIVNDELVFRGKSFSDWYELAYDAFDTWYDGDKWGRLFEKIGEQLEELDFERTLEAY